MKNKKTSWGEVANWYDEALEKREGTFQKEVIQPNVLRLLGLPDISDAQKTILDLACGQGFFTREIAKGNSKNKIIGSDISNELINLAKQNPDRVTKQIEYHVSPATDVSFCADQSIDQVLISLALQNIENVAGVFKECSRVLKYGKDFNKSGQMIIVLNHPAFRIPKRSSWGWDNLIPVKPALYRRLDGYISESTEKIDMTPGEVKGKKYTISFHRPIEYYVKLLSKAGFVVTRMEEWISHRTSEPGPKADEENRMRKEIPMFLMIEAYRFK